MTDEAKERYNEDREHFEVIRSIVKEELKTINQWQNRFFLIVLGCFAFFFVTLMAVSRDVQSKADREVVKAEFDKAEKTYMEKFDYYQIELDEHRVMKGILKDPVQADYLFDVINDNIASKLGFKYTTRGGEK